MYRTYALSMQTRAEFYKGPWLKLVKPTLEAKKETSAKGGSSNVLELLDRIKAAGI